MRIRLALTTASLLILIELLARLYFVSQPSGEYNVLDGIPAAVWQEHLSLISTWDDRGFWTTDRKTLPTIAAQRTIYMLGSSVMVGQYVRSADTIPSYLQRFLNNYRVVNLAAPAQYSGNVYRQVKTLPLRPGDIVIMEATQDAAGVYNLQKQNNHCASLALVQLFCQPHVDEAMSAGQAQETLFAVHSTRVYVQAHGARFLYVVMPYFYSLNPQTAREKLIDANTNATLSAVYRDAWKGIYSKLVREPDVLDLSHALDAGRMAGKDYFRDIYHFDAPGNVIVARTIWRELFGAF